MVSPLEGMRAALPGAEVSYSVGAVVQEGIAELPLDQMTNPVDRRTRCLRAVPGRRRRRAVPRGPARDRAGLVRRRRPDRRGQRPRADHPLHADADGGRSCSASPAVGAGRVYVDGELRHRRRPVAAERPTSARRSSRRRRVDDPGRRSTAGTPVDAAVRVRHRRRGGLRWPGRSGAHRSASSPRRRRPGRADRRGGRGGRAPRTSRSSWSAPTRRVESEGFDRDVARRCPAGRTSWSAPSPRRTRAPSWWSTPARRC